MTVQTASMPDFIADRLVKLETVINMASDEEWRLTDEERNRVLGALVYFTFIASCLFSSPLPRLLSLAIALTFLLNGMYVPFSHGLALGLLVLTSLPPGQTAPQLAPLKQARA